ETASNIAASATYLTLVTARAFAMPSAALWMSDCCRDYARRENKARTAIKNPVGYLDTGQPTNLHFLSNKNNALRGAKSGASIPLNVLGGYRWPGATPVEPEVLRKIVRAELGK